MHVEGGEGILATGMDQGARRGACGSRVFAGPAVGAAAPQAGRRADTIGTCHTA